MRQETHWTSDIHLEIQHEWKGTILFNEGSTSACSGAILFNKRLDFGFKRPKHDNRGRPLAAAIAIDNTNFNLINIYAPNTDTYGYTP